MAIARSFVYTVTTCLGPNLVVRYWQCPENLSGPYNGPVDTVTVPSQLCANINCYDIVSLRVQRIYHFFSNHYRQRFPGYERTPAIERKVKRSIFKHVIGNLFTVFR